MPSLGKAGSPLSPSSVSCPGKTSSGSSPASPPAGALLTRATATRQMWAPSPRHRAVLAASCDITMAALRSVGLPRADRAGRACGLPWGNTAAALLGGGRPCPWVLRTPDHAPAPGGCLAWPAGQGSSSAGHPRETRKSPGKGALLSPHGTATSSSFLQQPPGNAPATLTPSRYNLLLDSCQQHGVQTLPIPGTLQTERLRPLPATKPPVRTATG